ncbi:aldo/keto reductase [Paenibacillus koleovorans]|uniref:aldo/keto reductase n=1 Tax=Paenibacillus koleovorans TaxID=121608 RepID=UPI000FD6C672|nr:aldo/keto reductase [Paenibacillus koleovorans]
MHYTTLGRSGLRVSRLCLGTMNFGEDTDEREAHRIMDAALDAGINFIDTSNSYGGDGKDRGKTEAIIGRWLAGGGRRERVVLATKVYGNMEDPADGPNGGYGLSAYKVRRHLEASLRRLQTDHIDLYQMHHIDRNVSWDELWEVFQRIVADGKATYIGSSNFAARDLVRAQYEAKSRHMLGLISEQHRYSLMCRLPELELLPGARELGIGVLAYSPLEGGLLGNIFDPAKTSARSERARRRIERHREKLVAFAALCKELGESESNVALAWVLANPAITSPIIGPRTMEQFESCLRAVEIRLDASTLKQLDEFFPGPGGSAPEAYAW